MPSHSFVAGGFRGRPLPGLVVSLVALSLALLIVPLAALAAPSPESRAAPNPPPPRCVNVGGTAGCFSSVQAAILTATPGTHIAVWTGTYHERVTMTEGIVVEGEGWTQTIIDGDFSAPLPVVYFPSGLSAATVLSGVQVTRGGNGNPAAGGGGISVQYASPRIVNTFVNSNTGLYGGGVIVNSGAPAFDNVPAWSNLAVRGGGYYLTNNAVVTITGNPFEGTNGTIMFNRAQNEGGGIFIGGAGSALLAGLRIYFNDAYYGGGVDIVSTAAPVQLLLNDVSYNTASSGAGLRGETVGNLALNFNLFTNNWSSYAGAGLYFTGVQGRAETNVFLNNVAAAAGGGAYISDSAEGLLVRGNWFEANRGSNGGGFAVLGSLARPLVDANVVVSNTAALGGGIYLYQGSTMTLSNNIVARNVSTATGQIGGIQVSQTPARLINNTVAHNSGTGISFANSNGIVIANNIVAVNTVNGIERYPADTAVYTVDYNDVYLSGVENYEMVGAGAHDVTVDPLFVVAGPNLAAFYHLQAGSPVQATGSTAWAPPHDFDGELRIFGGVSMGADEVSLPVVSTFLPLLRR